MVWAPWPTSDDAPRVFQPLEKPKIGEATREIFRRRYGAENQRERKALRQAEIYRGNSLPEGEIVAVITAIELDFIGIIITIISTTSTIITAVSTPSRCNILGISQIGIKVYQWNKKVKGDTHFDKNEEGLLSLRPARGTVGPTVAPAGPVPPGPWTGPNRAPSRGVFPLPGASLERGPVWTGLVRPHVRSNRPLDRLPRRGPAPAAVTTEAMY
ncbi:hypothetical protein QYE76_051913 [Lolium multiflorum]|uniref:Uncharacterized protein n=1 Tax=Lolium multiflorum TaxID=4521 RepID=A0AAD8STS6_LOLMU|nr:hypothetical protein QYE76_051913 [Lolium multiflorum]